MSKKISAKAMLELITSTQYMGTSDICLLGYCGRNKAQTIIKEIKARLEEKGFYTPARLVPTEDVINYFNIDVDYLKELVKGL